MNWETLKRKPGKLLKYPLFSQLWFERWFRWAFLGLIGMVIFLALFLPKMWRASEAGFLPVIKVSGLDLVQAWSLRRTAIKASAAGNFDEANYAWLAAAGNNQADPRAFRGSLQTILLDPHRKEHAFQAMQHAGWLLRLTKTNNPADLELAARVYEQFKMYEQVTALLEPRDGELTPVLAGAFLKALFHQGRMDEFDAAWKRLEAKAASDPELRLYRAAYLAGWGPPGTITEARKQLADAARQSSLQALACRLQLYVSGHELDVRAYQLALARLEEIKADTLSEHAGYWRLLGVTGRKEEAIRLAQGYPNPPSSPIEVLELATIHAEFGSRDQALEILERYSKDFGQSLAYWITYGTELVEAKRWDDVRRVALRIRSEPGIADQLSAFSYFLEGRAELALGRDSFARAAFAKAADRDFPFPSLGQRVAGQLLQLGEAENARQILGKLEKRLNGEASYWGLVFAAADQLKDLDLLIKSATRAYELRPNDAAAINNYAAALIISRRNPQEAIKLTMQLFAQNPNSLHAVVNHGAALLQNDRPREAEALLARVRTNTLSRAQLALYNLDLFETYVGLHEYDRAWQVSDQIETNRLYPAQVEWLDSTRRQLPARAKSG